MPKETKKIQQSLIFKVGVLANMHEGAHEDFELNGFVELNEPSIKQVEPITGMLRVMKLSDEFNVQLHDIKIGLQLTCAKCLDVFTYEMHVEKAEIPFLFEHSKDIEATEDVFFTNTKNWTIDVTEFLRQEIILHFPLVSVCSTHCKGIKL